MRFSVFLFCLFLSACVNNVSDANARHTQRETTNPVQQPHEKYVFSKTKFVCPPCYHVKDIFDAETYHKDGQCSICGMNLIEQNLFEHGQPPLIHEGSGNFFFLSKRPSSNRPINVFYHKPKKYNLDSAILLVIPGAARNAWDYRDSWVDISEKYNVLIMSPSYSKKDNDFAKYHLGGVISSIEFTNFTVSKDKGRVNKYHLADKDLIKGEAAQAHEWLFNDFDDLFDHVVHLTGGSQRNYDIFGHSAGGQILHRMAIFHPNSKANRVIAANSGSYTLPSFLNQYPFGLKDTRFNKESVNDIFSQNLTVLVGEQDNDGEQRGTLLHTPILDKQGLGRLSRAQNFYKKSQATAKQLNAEFEWKFCVVEDVGHDYKRMGVAAAKLLYEDQKCDPTISIAD